MSGEPIRLLNDSSIRDEIRQRLAREASIKPAYDVERGLGRLRAAIANLPSDGKSGPASDRLSRGLSVTNYAVKGSVWKVAGIVGLASTALAIGIRVWPPTGYAGAETSESPTLARHVASPSQQMGPGVARAESDNLAQIRATLVTDPLAALALADDGNHLFGADGALGAEREVSAIDALVALGRRAEAQARALRFLVNYPKSPLSDRLRQNIGL